MKTLFLLTVLLCFSFAAAAEGEKTPPIRVGIIGVDTSHCIAFTKILHHPKRDDVAGFRVVAAFPGGSPDIPPSRDRIEGFTKQLRDNENVEIVGSIDELLKKVNVVLIESVDGRPHLEQVIPVLKAGKKVFIDKPIAGSLADVLRIFTLAGEAKVPLFSSSSLRFYPGIAAANERQDRQGARLRHVRSLLAGGAPPRPVLVRRPWRRGAVHDHGHRLQGG